MGDIMRPVPFGELLNRIFSEYKESQSIFGIPSKQFYRKDNAKDLSVWGENCETPVGPAAGPHTQLAQNIICSWLAGGRFMELKTVQKLDQLELAKPCIDAEDECFNTEWSTEFTLIKAYDEYLKAWIALHLLEEVFAPRGDGEEKSFIFNMSVAMIWRVSRQRRCKNISTIWSIRVSMKISMPTSPNLTSLLPIRTSSKPSASNTVSSV